MSKIEISHFLRAETDYEAAKLSVMAGLKDIRIAFGKSRIYPDLADLIKLYNKLQMIVRGASNIRDAIGRPIKGFDKIKGQIIYGASEMALPSGHQFEQLIQWALPEIENLIDEGKAIFEFVSDNIDVEQVGILPTYIKEGYLFIPNIRLKKTSVIRYEISIFASAGERYRSLKTKVVMESELTEADAEWPALKLVLAQKYHDLPNPATWLFVTDLDFPFVPTILPIAKRKLLRKLAA